MRNADSLRLVIDVQNLQSEHHSERGIARYIACHVKELLRYKGLVHSLWLSHARPFPKTIDPEILFSRKLRWASPSDLRDCDEGTTAVYWITSPFETEPFETLYPKLVGDRRVPLVVTLYDLIPLIHPDVYLVDPGTRMAYTTNLELLKLADLVLAISESAKQDAIRLLGLSPEKIAVIHAGVSPFFCPSSTESQDHAILHDALPGLKPDYIYTVLGEDPRKNLDGLLEAFNLLPSHLRAKFQLVIGGRYRNVAMEEILARVPDRIRTQILFTNYVADLGLRALYRNCALFVFPSKYEGFGLPLAEAVACGAPAITSNTSSLPEIIDFRDATFDPHDPNAMAVCMAAALDDEDTRARIKIAGCRRIREFRWEHVAEKSIRAIARMAPRPCPKPRRTRLSVGLVGPFPNEASGIADYNLRIARELAKICDLHIFYTDGSDIVTVQGIGAVECHPISSIGRSVWPQYLDHLVYTFGNSEHHIESYLAFQRVPGVLWLHEAHLLDFYLTFARRMYGEGADAWLLSKAREMYGQRRFPPLEDPETFNPQSAQDWALHMSRELVSSSYGAIFNSTAAREMVVLDLDSRCRLPPHFVVPHAASEVELGPERAATAPSQHPIVSSFGIVDTVKAPELLIEGVALLALRTKFTLRMVGLCEDAYRRELEFLVRHRNLQGRVQFTGRVDESEWCRYIQESACAIQLRKRSNGESSGAVLSCISHGVPVITNVAACLELPPGTVLQVPFDCTAAEVAQALASVLGDQEVSHSLRANALRYAREHTYSKVAKTIIENLPSLVPHLARSGEREPRAIATSLVPNSLQRFGALGVSRNG